MNVPASEKPTYQYSIESCYQVFTPENDNAEFADMRVRSISALRKALGSNPSDLPNDQIVETIFRGLPEGFGLRECVSLFVDSKFDALEFKDSSMYQEVAAVLGRMNETDIRLLLALVAGRGIEQVGNDFEEGQYLAGYVQRLSEKVSSSSVPTK